MEKTAGGDQEGKMKDGLLQKGGLVAAERKDIGAAKGTYGTWLRNEKTKIH